MCACLQKRKLMLTIETMDTLGGNVFDFGVCIELFATNQILSHPTTKLTQIICTQTALKMAKQSRNVMMEAHACSFKSAHDSKPIANTTECEMRYIQSYC